jgi:SAM-dependent methyltransferase
MIGTNKIEWSEFVEWSIQNNSKFNEAYFEWGEGSSYYNYSWKPELITPVVNAILESCKIQKRSKILDFGCAKGFYVKVLSKLGHDSLGVDISEYAILNAPEDIKERLFLLKDFNLELIKPNYFDLIIAKDVLEHLPEFALLYVIQNLKRISKKILITVPVCNEKGTKYINLEDEKDTTHIIRYTREMWQYLLNGIECSNLCALIKHGKNKGTFCCYIDSSAIIDTI